MGRHPCDDCGDETFGEGGSCEKCGYGYGDGNTFCNTCFQADLMCSLCQEDGCEDCLEESECCGLQFCVDDCDHQQRTKKQTKLSPTSQAQAQAAQSSTRKTSHEMFDLDCGHKGCNMMVGCRVCTSASVKQQEDFAIEDDKNMIQKLLFSTKKDGVKSEALREVLELWIKDPEGKSLKREREDVEIKLKDTKREMNWRRK